MAARRVEGGQRPWSDHLRIVLCATPRYFAAWPRVSQSGSAPGARLRPFPRSATCIGSYPKMRFPNAGRCHRHRLARRRQLERPERSNDRLGSARRRVVVQRLAEREARARRRRRRRAPDPEAQQPRAPPGRPAVPLRVAGVLRARSLARRARRGGRRRRPRGSARRPPRLGRQLGEYLARPALGTAVFVCELGERENAPDPAPELVGDRGGLRRAGGSARVLALGLEAAVAFRPFLRELATPRVDMAMAAPCSSGRRARASVSLGEDTLAELVARLAEREGNVGVQAFQAPVAAGAADAEVERRVFPVACSRRGRVAVPRSPREGCRPARRRSPPRRSSARRRLLPRAARRPRRGGGQVR